MVVLVLINNVLPSTVGVNVTPSLTDIAPLIFVVVLVLINNVLPSIVGVNVTPSLTDIAPLVFNVILVALIDDGTQVDIVLFQTPLSPIN